MKKSLLINFVLLLFLGGLAQGQDKSPYLFVKTDKKGTSKAAQDSSYVKGISVIASLRLLASDKNEKYRVPLPDGKEITILRRRVEGNKKAKAWYGEVENEKASFVFFATTGKALNGRIEIGKKHYRVIYLGAGVHQIAELDVNKMKEADDDGVVPKYGKPRDRSEKDDCADAASDIDVMVVYTQAAEDGAGGPEGMEALIYESVFLTNLAYENSDINQRLRLVHSSKVDYAEAADSVTDRERLRDPADGFMDGIHALRDAHGADLVLLIVETAEGTNCGRAFIMDPVSADHEAFAFGVIKRECAADNLSFPHEAAHIMSARHQDDTTTTPFAFGHGFFQTTPADGSGLGWETMMSKRSDCVRKIFFSNPDIEFSPTGSASTDPMGTAAQRDNHRTLNSTAETVANFRCSSPGVNNVWMKDAWNDTGLEPDPATAGQDMWRSPYVWVRNAQDATFLHQHENQDPEFGATNWIYVKMHNGSATEQNGNLELHVADASISLTWPASWTLLASVPVTIGAHSTRIVEREWNTVPNPGTHFCMIVRWVSASDPMHTPEGSGVEMNARENNNIIWRNFNVVDLASDADSKVVLNIAGLKLRTSSRIVFEDVTNFPKPRFTSTGKVIVTIDDELHTFWKKGGGKSLGLRSSGKNTFELTASRASLDNVLLPENYKGKITVVFKKGNNTPRSRFEFSVRHYLMNKDTPKLLGGVDYELVSGKK